MSDTDLFKRIIVPVADKEDAKKTLSALSKRLKGTNGEVIAVFVVQQTEGFIDKVPPGVMKEHANEVLDVFVEQAENQGFNVRKAVLYGTDVSDTIFEYAEEEQATSIAFIPRRASRWSRLLTGDIALNLITKTDIPVIILPKNQE